MQNARKTLKVLHTVASGGLVGGAGAYIVLLGGASPETAAGYADMRATIATLTNFILMPSLGVAIVSGLLAMIVHPPFLDKGWVWIKALMGILMFQAVLVLVVGEANAIARDARALANAGEEIAGLQAAHVKEIWTLGVVLALSLANIVFGVWRMRLMKPAATGASQ